MVDRVIPWPDPPPKELEMARHHDMIAEKAREIAERARKAPRLKRYGKGRGLKSRARIPRGDEMARHTRFGKVVNPRTGEVIQEGDPHDIIEEARKAARTHRSMRMFMFWFWGTCTTPAIALAWFCTGSFTAFSVFLHVALFSTAAVGYLREWDRLHKDRPDVF